MEPTTGSTKPKKKGLNKIKSKVIDGRQNTTQMPSMEDDESISLFGFYACTAGWHEGHCHSCNGFWASVLVLALLVVVRAPLLISIGVDTLNTFLLWAS